MTAVIAIEPRVETVTAPLQIQHAAHATHATVSQYDIHQFQQALTSHARADIEPNNIIKAGVAAIEEQEAKMGDVLLRITAASGKSMSTSSLLAFQSEHLKMHAAYEITARAISLTAQDITELMRMQ